MKLARLQVLLVFTLLCGCSRPYEVRLSVATGKSFAEMGRASEIDGFGSHWEIGTYQQFLTAPKIWEERIAPKINGKIRDPEKVRRSIKLSVIASRDVGDVRVSEMRLQITGDREDDLSMLADLLAGNIEHFTRMYWGEKYAPYVRGIAKPNQPAQPTPGS